MYCPSCGAQIEQAIKFCKACGLKVTDHARLLEAQREAESEGKIPMRREKRMMTGVVLTLVTAFDLLIFLSVFGAITLSHVGYRSDFVWQLVAFLTVSLITGGLGVFNLVRSGFFSELQERQLRYELARLEQRQKALAAKAERTAVESRPGSRLVEQVSVTEATTRELRGAPEVTREVE
jgi:hypothetical protein